MGYNVRPHHAVPHRGSRDEGGAWAQDHLRPRLGFEHQQDSNDYAQHLHAWHDWQHACTHTDKYTLAPAAQQTSTHTAMMPASRTGLGCAPHKVSWVQGLGLDRAISLNIDRTNMGNPRPFRIHQWKPAHTSTTPTTRSNQYLHTLSTHRPLFLAHLRRLSPRYVLPVWAEQSPPS